MAQHAACIIQQFKLLGNYMNIDFHFAPSFPRRRESSNQREFLSNLLDSRLRGTDKQGS